MLVAGYFLFRPMLAFSAYYRGLSFERMLSIRTAMHYYQRSIDIDPNVPEGWTALREDSARIEQAIEESLRIDSPAQMVTRIATTDVEIGAAKTWAEAH